MAGISMGKTSKNKEARIRKGNKNSPSFIGLGADSFY
jgi:hypothetical protein